MEDIKFESSIMERFILAYLIKDKSFFLKVGIYLKTNNFNKKSYFIDSKLQWILNTCLVYYEKYEKIPSLDTINILCDAKFKDDTLLLKAISIFSFNNITSFKSLLSSSLVINDDTTYI